MMPREGTMIADRYRLDRKVGGGRVSAMWLVRDQVTDSACAVKLLHRSMNDHPEALARFSLEDRLARELTGAYFPERVGSGSWHSQRYIAWRWYEGECLRALFERNPKQDAQTVNSIVQEVCQALTLVHASGYTHGDLKPENVFFADRAEKDPSRQLKLFGFGVASRLARPLLGAQARRTPGQIVGTPLYLSPDLILGRVPRGGQADLWALSVIVYEALTGRVPFLGDDMTAVLQAILERQAPKPTSIADGLPATFDLWWAQALEQEFTTPGEFATSLARALAPALRSSRTQRSASLPDRAASVPAPAAPAAAPAAIATVESPPGIVALASSALDGPTIQALPAPNPSEAEPRATGAALPHPRPLQERASAALPSAAPEVGSSAADSDAGAVNTPDLPSVPDAGGAAQDGPAVASPNPAPHPLASSTPAPRLAVQGVPSGTVSGLGPAPLSLRRAMQTAAAGATAKLGAAAAGTGADTFAPLPAPLSELSALGLRKTLVGIIPPPKGAPPPSPSSPVAAPAESLVIAGAPCKTIETATGDEEAELPLASLPVPRRAGNPTVPFPRPRAVPRATLRDLDAVPGSGQPSLRDTWQRRTSNTLRIVLTNPSHRPHLIAGVLVCAAAALVIFAMGRSPVAGTGVIGQATNSLSAERGAPGVDTRPAVVAGALTAPPVTADPVEILDPEPGTPVDESPLRGEELAPGLVIPPRPPPGVADSPAHRGPAGAPSPSSPSGSAAAPRPDVRAPSAVGTHKPGAFPSAEPSAAAKIPDPAPAPRVEPAPPRGGDFDFGI